MSGSVTHRTYFEFGCHSARTFCAAMNAASYLKSNFEFFAFDSFKACRKQPKKKTVYLKRVSTILVGGDFLVW